MMDEDTITIGYRDWRGEPRGKLHKDTAAPVAGQGDCIDCMACVNVCPMGIDIRDGQQLACITCGLCIDACNDVMDKIGRPHDLIGYLALTDERAERDGTPPKKVWQHVFRPRTILYTTLWAGIGVALIVALFLRPDVDFNVTPVRNPTFVTLSDGSIRNTYDVRLRNKTHDARSFAVLLAEGPDLTVSVEGSQDARVTVAADATAQVRIYLLARPNSPEARADRTAVRFWVQEPGASKRSYQDTIFNGTGK